MSPLRKYNDATFYVAIFPESPSGSDPLLHVPRRSAVPMAPQGPSRVRGLSACLVAAGSLALLSGLRRVACAESLFPDTNLDFSADLPQLNLTAALDGHLQLVTNGSCPSVCLLQRHSVHSICNMAASLGVSVGIALGGAIGGLWGAGAASAVFGQTARELCMAHYDQAKEHCYVNKCPTKFTYRGEF